MTKWGSEHFGSLSQGTSHLGPASNMSPYAIVGSFQKFNFHLLIVYPLPLIGIFPNSNWLHSRCCQSLPKLALPTHLHFLRNNWCVEMKVIIPTCFWQLFSFFTTLLDEKQFFSFQHYSLAKDMTFFCSSIFFRISRLSRFFTLNSARPTRPALCSALKRNKT